MSIFSKTNTNLFLTLFKKILAYAISVIEKSLYFPYMVSLLVFLLIIMASIETSGLGVFNGTSLSDIIFKFIFDIHLLPHEFLSRSENIPWTELKSVILERMIIFGILFDLISRSIKLWKKNLIKTKIHFYILKFLLIFYTISGTGLITFFNLKGDKNSTPVILMFILINLMLLLIPTAFTFLINIFYEGDIKYYFSKQLKYSKESKIIRKLIIVAIILMFLVLVAILN